MSQSSATDQGARPDGPTGFRHEAVLYAGTAGLVASLVPWMRAGMNADDTVIALVTGRSGGALREALGQDAGGVHFADMGEAGRNPARIISVWRRLLLDLRRPGRAVRAIGEPVWPGRDRDELDECRLHEALLNPAFGREEGLWLRCPYDVGALDPEVVGTVGGSHPMVTGAQAHLCGQYAGPPAPASILSSPLSAALEPVVEESISLATLRTLRESVRARAVAAGLGPQRVRDLVLAVIEVSSNSIMHGGGSGILRSWETRSALVHEINDAGRIDDALVGRNLPLPDQAAGRGLWLVNELCDLVQLRSSSTGTIVRMHMRTR